MARSADLLAAARVVRAAAGAGGPGVPGVAAYALRQAWLRARGRHLESLRSYRPVGEELARLETPLGPVYVPTSLSRADLAALLRDTLDPRAWHRYDGPWAPLRDGDVVVDCGASVGIWALHAARLGGQLILVEPQDAFARALERTFAPRLEAGAAELHRCALGAAAGRGRLGGAALTAKLGGDGQEVEVRTLDELLDGRRVDFVKADVEGAELELVRGAGETIRRHRPTLALTVYHPENDWRRIRDDVLGLAPGYTWRTRGLTGTGKPVLLLLEHKRGKSLVRGMQATRCHR